SAPADVLVAGARDRRRDRDRDGRSLRTPRPAPASRSRTGSHPGHLASGPRRRVRRERRRYLHRGPLRGGARLSRTGLFAARPVRKVDRDRARRPGVRARPRPRAGVPVPGSARRRPCVPAQPSRQRLPRNDRPRAVQRRCADRCRFRQTATGEYSPRVRCGLVIAASLLIAVPAAEAARAQFTIQATPAAGPAPLEVTFTTTDATAAHWDFGDGTSADV